MSSGASAFHPASWLGVGFNTLDKNIKIPLLPAELQEEDALIDSKAHRPVAMSKTTAPYTWSQTNTTWNLPDNVEILDDFQDFDSELYLYSSGSELSNALSASVSVSAGYAGVSVTGGVSYDSKETYSDSMSYAFLVKTISGYVAKLLTDNTSVNAGLLTDAKALPTYAEDPEVERKYLAFWSKYGTHVIKQAEYGWHFQLECQQDKSTVSSKESFGVNIEAKYMGNGASAQLTSSTDYQNFQSNSRTSVKAIGGNPSKAELVESSPADQATKQDWLGEAGTKDDAGLFKIKAGPLSDIFDDLTDDEQGTYSNISLQLRRGLYSQTNQCRRRLSIWFPQLHFSDIPAGVQMSLLYWTFRVHLESANGLFHEFADPETRRVATISEGAGDNNYFNNNGLQIGMWVDVYSNFSPTIQFSIESTDPSGNWPSDQPNFTAEFAFVTEKYNLDGTRTVVAEKRQSFSTGVLTPRQGPIELEMKPELDFA